MATSNESPGKGPVDKRVLVGWRAVAIPPNAPKGRGERGRVREIEAGGVLFESDNLMGRGAKVRLAIMLPPPRREAPARIVEVACTVAWSLITRDKVSTKLTFDTFMQGGRAALEAVAGISLEGDDPAV
jgi:hypothetical protein